ncbi:MAG TPA: NADH-quinone oxidoreductase subunit NuoF [Gaiellaceae bacterium]
MAEVTDARAIVLAGADAGDLTTLAGYRAVGGYEQLGKARRMEPQQVLEELLASSVRGRGGAGFPMGRKASFLARGTGRPTYLAVNADESEPGTCKDREIMQRVPHRVLEGCLITAHTIGCRHVFVYLRGEYLGEFEVLRAALDEAREAGLLDDVTVVLHRGAGAYICGEETALLESLEGARGQPRPKPPFPAVIGLYASPTLINNVETIATVPKILELGGEAYARLGVANSSGTRVFSLSGNVVRPGNYELLLGTSLRELIYEIGGGIPEGRELKAVIPGGSSTPILRADEIDGVTLDFDSMAAAGSQLGSGAVIVLDERACIVQLALRVAAFYEYESCGKCVPCRIGTRWVSQILHPIEAGTAEQGTLDFLLDVCDRILGKCLCPLGDSDAIAVASYVTSFRDEFQRHIDEGRCPFGGMSSLERVPAPIEFYPGRGRSRMEVAHAQEH